MSEARRRRGDFVRATTRVLTEVRSGDLLAATTGTRLCEIAATTCGAAWAGLYLLVPEPGSVGSVVEIARSPDEEGATARVTAELLAAALAAGGMLARDDQLVQAISAAPEGQQANSHGAMAYLVLHSPPSGRGGIAFTEVDHQRIRILAILAALKEEAAGGTASSDMLARVTQSLMQEPTTDGKLTQLASYLAEATHSDHACIWIRPHAQSSELRLRATHGVDDQARAAARTHDRSLQADLARMSVLNGPAAVATSALPWLSEILGVGEHILSEEAIVTPIRRSKGVAGVAICSGPPDTDRKSGTTTAMEKQVLLRALADQIALTTEYVRTTLDAQQNARRFALLAAIGEISLAKIGMEEMLDAILARIQEYFDAASCNLYLLGSDRASLRTRSVQRQDSTNGAARCEIKVALVSGEKTLGTVNLRRAASNPFDEIDHETLQQVAEQMSLALTTSGRYQMQASLAVLDTLTDLPNRRSAEATLQREIERAGREGTVVSIALLDVDSFKSINDTHGHAAGDEVLRETARMFKAQLRATDYIARWGGEEFLILLPGSDNLLGPRICERIRHSVSLVTVRDTSGAIITITASLGGASFLNHGADLPTLLKLADNALYRAKTGGRNRLCWAGEPEPR